MRLLRAESLLALLLPLACATTEDECRLSDPPLAGAAAARAEANVDLSAVKPFHNYLAVASVGPFGHHFLVSVRGLEPMLYRLHVEKDAAGKLRIHEEGGWWDAPLPPGQADAPPPPEVGDLMRALEAELFHRCLAGRPWSISYAGAYREVRVVELVAHDQRTGNRRGGWKAAHTLVTDEALTRLVGPSLSSTSWFGAIELPAGARWVPLDEAQRPTGSTLISERIEDGGPLTDRTLEIARRMVAGTAAPALESVGPPPGAPFLPSGYDARVVATVHIIGGRRGDAWVPGGKKVRLPLNLQDAVFGPRAEATGEATLGNTHLKLRASLTPEAPRASAPTMVEERYRGTLAVHAEDDQGHAWDHTYAASGSILVEAHTAVAPTGLAIPGASAPSPEADARIGRLAGGSDLGVIELAIDPGLFDDPRRR